MESLHVLHTASWLKLTVILNTCRDKGSLCDMIGCYCTNCTTFATLVVQGVW